jgi:hypothetical protein
MQMQLQKGSSQKNYFAQIAGEIGWVIPALALVWRCQKHALSPKNKLARSGPKGGGERRRVYIPKIYGLHHRHAGSALRLGALCSHSPDSSSAINIYGDSAENHTQFTVEAFSERFGREGKEEKEGENHKTFFLFFGS